MENIFAAALNITSPFFISLVNFDKEAKRLDIYIDFEKGTKFSFAGHENLPVHDTRSKEWRHLNFFENECYLHARVPRLKFPDGEVKTYTMPWEGKVSGFTLLFEALLLQLAKEMPVHVVGQLTNVYDHKIWTLLKTYVGMAREMEDYSDVRAIGIDETSRAKHHNYITLFVDLETRKSIFITEGKDSSTLREFSWELRHLKGDPKQITDVSCDMSPAFIKGVKEYLPNAEITFDKFHVIKLINDAVDKVRRNEVKQESILKGMRYAFLKNESSRTTKQDNFIQELEISKSKLKTFRALRIREAFQDLYNTKDIEEFSNSLKEWYFWATHSKLAPIIGVAKTIKKHWDGILNWKRSQINNGILEGLNSVIQAVKARARGFRTAGNFITIAYLVTGKLNFSSVNNPIRVR